jgi:arylsulfatase A-like enzyme
MRPASIALALLAGTTIDCGATRPRPNVVLVVMDTTRADHCSFVGCPRDTTPRLAAFAKDAVVFSDAWSPAGWTGPAHASLFSGLRPEHHGFHDGNRTYLGPEFPTLAERLADAGYATACFTNNNWIAPEFGLTRGFQTVVAHYGAGVGAYPWAKETHELAAAWAESQAAAGRPFLLFVNDMEPHLPYTPPAEDAARFLRGDPPAAEVAAARAFDFPAPTAFALGAETTPASRVEILSDLYDAEIFALDREIGSLLDRLRADGLLDRTLVVVASDHGELLGEHRMIEHGHSMHRAARRIPLLLRLPGRFDGGRVEPAVVRLEDVPATILDVCGARPIDDVDGAPLLGELAGRVSIAVQGPNPGKRPWLEARYPGIDVGPYVVGMDAVYDGRFHAIAYSDGRRELFDVAGDPAETQNLASRDPDRLARLLSLARPPR